MSEVARTVKRSVPDWQEDAVRARLEQGLELLQLPLSAAQVERLVRYLHELYRINQIHNLTAIREPIEMVAKHLLDSLAVAKLVRTERLLDVGSGGGLPGIPLLIAGCCERVVLIDSVGKKTQASTDMARALGLETQIEAVHARVESLSAAQYRSEQIISRAFSSLKSFGVLAGPLLAPKGELLAMKGRYPEAELAELPKIWRVEAVHEYAVPFVDGERCLLRLKKH
jgi:16S rRNA (guanine527-N7)-methyltransferase